MASRIIIKCWRLSRPFLLIQRPLQLDSLRAAGLPQIQSFVTQQNKIAKFSTKPAPIADRQKQFLINPEHYLDKLKSELTSFGFVSIESLSQTVKVLNFNMSRDESIFLLDCCTSIYPSASHQDRLKVFYKIWDTIIKNGSPTKEHYLKAVKFLKENKGTVEDLQRLLIICNFKTDLEIYEGQIHLLAQQGKTNKINELISEIRNQNLKLNERILSSLIIAHSKNGNLKECKSVLDTMNAANIVQSQETFTELIIAHIENDSEENATKLITLYGSSLEIEQLTRIIRIAAVKKMKNIIEKCLKYRPKDFEDVKEIPAILRKECIELIYEGYPDEAFLIVNSFSKPNFNENQDTDTFGVFLIAELIKSGQPPSKVIEVCKELITSGKNVRTLHIACEVAIRRQSLDAFEYLKSLSELEPLRTHYFWPILLQVFRVDGEIGILNTLKTMSALGVECDYDTISFYVLPRLSVTLTNEKKAMKILEDCGLKTSQVLTPFVAHLIFQKKFEEIISLVEMYQSKVDTENLAYPLIQVAYNINATGKNSQLVKLLQTLKKKAQNPSYDLTGQFLIRILANPQFKNDSKTVLNIINEFKTNGLKISRTAVDVLSRNAYKDELKHLLFKMVDDTLNLPNLDFCGLNISHPRDMNLEELECHLVELESKNLNTRGVLRRLLQLLVREGKLERALQIKEQCERLKVQISPGMLASIFDMNIKLKRMNDAEKSFVNMKKGFPGFRLDEHKIIDFAALLVENNRLEDAKKILKERVSTKIVGGEYIQKNVWQLLTNVANLSSSKLPSSNDPMQNKTKQFFNMLCELGYCTPCNTLLGPIIREYILRGEIKSAVAEYKEIVKNYRKTPLQFELMSLLVGLSNGVGTDVFKITENEAKELLQEVVTSTASVHGGTNTNVCLILAVAESGTDGQLRKLLIDPNFRFNEEILMKNCQHLSNSGKINSILKLAKASRGLRHIIKEQHLYDILLSNFIRENDYVSALKLFEKLEADDEFKITQEFTRNLVNLLKVNNYEIPSSLSLRAQVV